MNLNIGKSNREIIYFQWSSFILFLILSFTMLLFHEAWRDEAQACLISWQSTSIGDLYNRTRYEGHPVLWFCILYGLKTVGASTFFIVQVCHWLIANFTAYILIFQSRLANLWRLLIPWGYFFLYEYNIIARNYAVGLLFLFVGVYFLQQRKWIWASLAWSLAAFANAFSLLIVAALGLFLLINHFKEDKKRIVFSCIILGLAGFSVIYLTLPPSDVGFAHIPNYDPQGLLNSIFRVFMPLPSWKVDFWNTNVVKFVPLTLLAACVFGLLIYYFKHFKKVFIFFGVAMGLILAFLGLKYLGFLRHQGHIYMVFIIALWLKAIYHAEETIPQERFFNTFFTIIFLIQIYSSAVAYFFDYHYTFSQGKKAAQYITAQGLDKQTIIVDSDASGSTVSFFLNRPLLYANADRWGTYVIWDLKRKGEPATDSILYKMADSCAITNSVLLLKTDTIKSYSPQVQFIQAFQPDICGQESYYLYSWKGTKRED